MIVSVIIPVYNAEEYVRQAVSSALEQAETGEVVLVEDASTDGSLRLCRELAEELDRVRLLQHADRQNHGAGASRNLGIRHARFGFIAFLDADDFFLPERFSVATTLFEDNPGIDGVYEAVGTYFQNEAAAQRWQQRCGNRMLTTMTERVDSDRLFEALVPVGSAGWWHIDGWTVKRTLFDETGLFDEHLWLHQDTAMFVKAAAMAKMLPGRLDEPVAMRRVHDSNRISSSRTPMEQYRDRLALWAAVWKWGRKNLSASRQQLLMKRFIAHAARPYWKRQAWVLNLSQSARQLASVIAEHPALIADPAFWRSMYSVAAKSLVSCDLRSKSVIL